MKPREDPPGSLQNTIPAPSDRGQLARARKANPHRLPGLSCVCLKRYWRVFLVITGLVVQVVLTVMVWQLVDLSISLMEVWAELARKHLELTLS